MAEESHEETGELFRLRRAVSAEESLDDITGLDPREELQRQHDLNKLQVWEHDAARQRLRNRFVTGAGLKWFLFLLVLQLASDQSNHFETPALKEPCFWLLS